MLTIVSITKDDLGGIKETVKSVSRLKKALPIQHIVVDSSNLDSAKTIESLCKDNDIDYIYQKPKGISSAFNLGLSKTKYEWVWFLNGGDKVHPKLDPLLLKSLLKNSRANIIICEIENSSGITRKGPLYSLWLPVMNWIPHPGTITNTDTIRKLGGFDPTLKIASDGDLWFRVLSKDYSVDLQSFPIATFSPGGLSSNQKATSRETLRILWRYKSLILRRWLNCFNYIIRSVKTSIYSGYLSR